MEAYTFHEGDLPSGTGLAYRPAIFNLPRFIDLQNAPERTSFYLLDRRRNVAQAGVHYHIDGCIARSPYRAPFGSFDMAEKINPGALYGFAGFVTAQLTQRGVKEICLRNPPCAYNVNSYALLETFLLNLGYSVSNAEVSALIPVSAKPFCDIIRHSERLRLRQSERAGLGFQLLPPGLAPSVYEFIARCHGQKGYHLSISAEHFERTIRAFSESYPMSAVFQGDAMCAAAVSVRVTDNVLWNFLVSQDRAFNRLSPSVLLMQGIYDYCRRSGISMLDLGTSAFAGQPNQSLLDFKMHLGAVASPKLEFYKKIR